LSLFSLSYSQVSQFKFLDPLPNAKFINKETAITITPAKSIDKKSLLSENAFIINGSKSGFCNFQILLSDDGSTFILKPANTFQLGETVTVQLGNSIKTTSGKSINSFSYSFTVKQREVKVNQQAGLEFELASADNISHDNYYSDFIEGFPVITLNYYNNPSPGKLFFSNFTFSPQIPFTPYLIILKNNGELLSAIQKSAPCLDFNMQPNGHLTFFDFRHQKYFEMDDYYRIIDSFSCGNGYGTDLHELRLLSNRHALLMSYDSQYVDMSNIVPGGQPNAVVSGLIIQEIDANKNVVFQWRSWDHFQITDAWHENMYSTHIDAVHGNAIDLDVDGNILISSRHLDEITKINRSTGEVMWRLGGKNNQFVFINDPIRFNYQHAIRRLKNGNIILFDNGNYHTPRFSRAVEYNLDESNKIARLVWQYRNKPDVYAPAMGFAQRLFNGNTLICWGYASKSITEVRPDGTKTLELSLPAGLYTYRAFKYPYKEDGSGKIIPQTYVLEQNFPNPFNPATSIKFALPDVNSDGAAVNVKLSVYDVVGQEVAVLINDMLEPDSYRVEFNGTNISSGIYFYRLTAGSFIETKKMMLVK
jgi:hypothetical protein